MKTYAQSRRRKRFLAWIMILCMCLSNVGNYSAVWAAENEALEDDIMTVEETRASETKASETQSSETKASETQSSETKAPETQSSETKAPETQSSETNSPETQSSETNLPETQSSETNSPETQSSETKAPETQPSESEPPKEEETEQDGAGETLPGDEVVEPSTDEDDNGGEAGEETEGDTQEATEGETEWETETEEETELLTEEETEAVKKGELCTHHPIHTPQCGYVDGEEDAVCDFLCPICHREFFPLLETSGIRIEIPEEEEANLVSGRVDLLENIALVREDATPAENFTLKVYSVINSQDYLPEALEEERYLNTREGLNYLMIYGAYDPEGNLAAAAERVLVSAPMTAEEDRFVAYDTDSADTASIKVSVELPAGAEENLPEGYRLSVQKKAYTDYTTEEEAKRVVGEWNDLQCWDIHWEDENGNVVGDFPIFGESDVTATVTVEYLKAEARLKGQDACRKLMILNVSGGTLEEETAVRNVTVSDKGSAREGYKGFTFTTKARGPYVFASKKVFEGYIGHLSISEMEDGSEPFDGNNEPGNDSGSENRIVRSYDTINYKLRVDFMARSINATKEEARLHFEMTMDAGLTEAQFDTNQFLWLTDTYEITYLDGQGNEVLTRGRDGKYYKGGQEVDLNTLVKGNGESYADNLGIQSQKITGWAVVEPTSGDNVLSGYETYSAGIQVKSAQNGKTLRPSFKMWLEGNEENYGSESEEGKPVHPAQKVENRIASPEVTVSAGARYNLQLKRGNDISYKSWFDFSTGNEITDKDTIQKLDRLAYEEKNRGISDPSKWKGDITEEERKRFKYYRYGRITGYGLTLQLYNEVAGKNFRGFALPSGDITFDLTLTSDVEGGEDNFTPLLWEYNENENTIDKHAWKYADPWIGTVETQGGGKGNWERRLYWKEEPRTAYAKGCAPSNYKGYANGCYYGGNWLIKEADKVVDPGTVLGTGKDKTYHFTISDYDFDFDKEKFPVQDAGNSGTNSFYTSDGHCFSAGYIQVLNVFPRVQKLSVAGIQVTTEVSNLKVTTCDGQTSTTEKLMKDNRDVYSVTLYAPGGISKGNSFNRRGAKTVGDHYLGTDYWSYPNDCSIFAGSDISLLGFGLLNSNSDSNISALNLLQLFDSKALRIDTDAEIEIYQDHATNSELGTHRFLYAGDPHYSNGYDTNNDSTVMKHMNLVREEDLVYTEIPPDENGMITAGGMSLKCIGVLLELRGCDIQGGMYQYMCIPMKVSDDKDLVGKTVATVNSLRIWVGEGAMMSGEESITWTDGVWEEGKNHLDGYQDSEVAVEGEVALRKLENDDNKGCYIKCEFDENGQLRPDTARAGILHGNSLMILGYKAGIKIKVDRQGTDGNAIFDVARNETVVDYTLHGIETRISDPKKAKLEYTNLDIRVNLDGGKNIGEDRRIELSKGSYTMKGYYVNDQGQPVDEDDRVLDTDDYGCPYTEPVDIPINESTRVGIVYRYETPQGDKPVVDPGFCILNVSAKMPNLNAQQIQFKIEGAPVGVVLPDISFSANILESEKLHNNDKIPADVYISGTGDKRAYSTVEGNASSVTIGIIKGEKAFLKKTVDRSIMELDDTFTYTVTYDNGSESTMDLVYFYDLFPSRGDVRGSLFDGSIQLNDFEAKLGGSDQGFQADVTIYGSTTEYQELKKAVDGFNGKDAAKVDAMLENGTNESQEKLFFKLGTINKSTGEFVPSSGVEDEVTEKITGIYVKVKNLRSKRALSLIMHLQAKGNKAGDIYKNTAYCWEGDSNESEMFTTKVETTVVSRDISGVVWYDKNANGIRESGEPLLSGVTVTLFRLNGGVYKIWTTDVTGRPIGGTTTRAAEGTGSVLTNENGEYSFEKLPFGRYIVAFSGGELDEYMAASPYKASGSNASNSSDGVSIAFLGLTDEELGLEGKENEVLGNGSYAYAIKYDADSAGMELHAPKDMLNKNVPLDNFRERYTYQDLGLVNTGDLKIGKTVTEDASGNVDTDRTFTFEVEVKLEGQPITGVYDGRVFDEQGKTTVTLKHDESVTIHDLPAGAVYTVTETDSNGFNPDRGSATGTIEKDKTKEEKFTNVPPASVNTGLSVTKAVTGAEAPAVGTLAGKFTFQLRPVSGPVNPAPMPSEDTAVNQGGGGTVTFGDITFVKEGTYVYEITETDIASDINEKQEWTKDSGAVTATVVIKNEQDSDKKWKLAVESVTYTYKKGEETVPNSAVFTNTYAKKIDISGSKIWEDDENRDNIRPDRITLRLRREGSEEDIDVQTVTAGTNGDWKFSFTDLPKYDSNGTEIRYTLTENVVSGYTPAVTEEGGGFILTNTHIPLTVDKTVEKVWNDNNNQDGLRPPEIRVQLLADGEPEGGPVTLNSDNHWTYTWSGLPMKDAGVDIAYTVEEIGMVEGYTTAYSNDTFTITNTHTPAVVDKMVTKVWNDGNNQDGKRPPSIQVQLQADGEPEGGPATLNSGNNWTHTWNNLPKKKAGADITYTVVEIGMVQGYTTAYSNSNDTFTITNTHTPETITIQGKKTWDDARDQDGKRPSSITVRLWNGSTEVKSQTVTANENWSWSFKDLPKYENGQEIKYTLTEDAVDDYSQKVDGYNVTNSYTPGETSKTVTKVWNDGNNQDGRRPSSILVQLLADGKEKGDPVTLNDGNNWTYTWSNLPEKAQGKEIAYTVKEIGNVEGYITTYSNDTFTITNTHIPETITIQGEKIWDDADNRDGFRPESITVNLLGNNKFVESKEVKPDQDGKWSVTFEMLPKYEKGVEIVYTVEEVLTGDAAKKYESEVTPVDSVENTFTITNKHTPVTLEIGGEKIWDDAQNQDGKRPDTITVELYAGEKRIDSKEIEADQDGKWTYCFENLYKYEDGKEIQYTVKEVPVKDYTTTYEFGENSKEIVNIRNYYKPGETGRTVKKIWEDAEDVNNIRPESISVQLLADGKAYGEIIILNSENGWTYTWESLPLMKNGKEITYTVQEMIRPEGYVTSYSEDTFIIVNKAISFHVNKVDLTDGVKEIEGAVLTVYEKESGKEVASWTSAKDEVHDFGPALTPGKTYTLKETVAPFGYKYAADMEFSVGEDGSITIQANTSKDEEGNTVYLVEDVPVQASLQKIDAATREDLAGASLRVLDKNGKVIDEWVTDGNGPHIITGKLGLGEIYTLEETKAPQNYNLAEAIPFTVGRDGALGPIVMEDARVKAGNASISVTKMLTYNGEPLHAVNKTFYVALYADDAGTIRLSDVKPMVFQNASSSTVEFTDLEIGRTYYVGEADAQGNKITAGILEDGTLYGAAFPDGNQILIQKAGQKEELSFENQFDTPPVDFYKEGILTITKKLLDAAGKAKNSGETFYAGIFADENCTILSNQVTENIVELNLNGESTVTAETGVMVIPGGVQTLYITEVDQEGNPVEEQEEFAYSVTVDGEMITMEENNLRGAVTITNQEAEEETEEITEEITKTTATKAPKNSVKTGDETPILRYVLLLAAAAVMALLTLAYRRRRITK